MTSLRTKFAPASMVPFTIDNNFNLKYGGTKISTVNFPFIKASKSNNIKEVSHRTRKGGSLNVAAALLGLTALHHSIKKKKNIKRTTTKRIVTKKKSTK